jgi:hypothetical protein
MSPSKLLAQDKAAVSAVAEAFANPTFQRGVALAFAAYVSRAKDDTASGGWAANCRRIGAQEILEYLSAVGREAPERPRQTGALEPIKGGDVELPQPNKQK